MSLIDNDGKITRAKRWPCRTENGLTGCGEIIRIDEYLRHLLDHHPEATPLNLILAAVASLPVENAMRYWDWCARAARMDDGAPATRDFFRALTTLDGPDQTPDALAACNPSDRAFLLLCVDVAATRATASGREMTTLWAVLRSIIDPEGHPLGNRRRP
ncbi:hypothetical protein ACIOD2_25765 [Amycolatopsis sp. NPDC088138]|uniref:hypothetical protein n=1 Tax=Amycolatopsis sp. NPDC088138 TaxID=3363938 RepID=UPI00382B2BD4